MKNFKTIIILVALLVSTNLITAQSKVDWREKNRFHRSIGETFHPMEEGDFKPIRTRSEELVKNAIAWQESAIPVDYKDIKNIKKNLLLIVKQSKALDAKIKTNASDEEVKKDLIELHDTFHTIVGLCTKEDHH
jgi:hypothetical protein